QVVNIPASIGNVLIMRLFHLSGGDVSRRQLGGELRTFLVAEYLVLNPLLACVAGVAFSFLTRQFIPDYAASIPVLTSLMCLIFFVPQSSLVRNFWMLDRRLGALAWSNILGLVAIG